MGTIVDEYLERIGRDERPDVEEYARRYPQLATVLRQMLPALQALRSSATNPTPSAKGPEPTLAPEGPLGDFRIAREIGRGGMGVVYEAVQISLGRRVALKVLPFAAALDAKQLQRFKNEAQAAAHLHHQNIVPVYAVGSERGMHYYAMQFIDGRTLAAVIHELRRLAGLESTLEARNSADGTAPAGSEANGDAALPLAYPLAAVGTEGRVREAAGDTWRASVALSTAHATNSPAFFRAAAKLAAQAAGALEHAHSLGIVHRDVKPANLLVDGRGNLWVTDFGLAQVQTDTRLTLSGDLVGTLRYMSPEQALGQAVGLDHRADLYSLGATLYELLTLSPVFDGRDRQELLRQIALEEPKPPRRINKRIPTELETIVLKAMAKNANERYATAKELGDDLQRFLQDEPIRAKRPTLLQRLRKWGRRHRPVVTAGAVGLLLALAVLAGSVGWVVRDHAARHTKDAADLQRALEDAQRSRKEGKWPQAQAAAKRAEALLEVGAAEPALVELVRRLVRELAEEEADGQMVARLEELRLLQAETDVESNRFVLERALPDYRQAFNDYGVRAGAMSPEEAAALLERRPSAIRGILMAALDHWLILARHKQAPETAWLARVLAIADSDGWRQEVRAARERGDRQALEALAREVDPATQPPEALFVLNVSLRQRGATEAAVALLRRAQEAFPGDFWINHDLGVALQNARPPQAEEAVRFLTAATALRPNSPGVRFNLGSALWKRGRHDEAAAAFRAAIDLKPQYALAYFMLTSVLSDKGQLDEAIAVGRRAVTRLPNNAQGHYNLGIVLAKNRQVDEAIAAYRRAIALDPNYAQAHCNLGLTLWKNGELIEAATELQRGHELGTQQADWLYPSARWLKDCRRFVELDEQLPAIIKGEVVPGSAAAWNEFAQLCYYRKFYVASARMRTEAFRRDAELANDLQAANRYDAACAAALAAEGRDVDVGALSDEESAIWRKQALEWLRADLTGATKVGEAGKPLDRVQCRMRLRHWQSDPDLASVRDPALVAKLPPDEQKAWNRLWADTENLVKGNAAK
jgi:serine/threonine protein kinase/Flp pilus assembly protein TadD